MSTNHIVDLSTDDSAEEQMRKIINRRKMNELRKYIPFLEFISNLDSVKYNNYRQLLRWLKTNKEFPANMAATCENNIIAKYNIVKLTVEIPTNIAEVFVEKDAILISDEDDEQLPSQSTSNTLETINLDEDYESEKGTTPDKNQTCPPNASASEFTDLTNATSSPKAVESSLSTVANSTTPNQSDANTSLKESGNLEEGEIVSDGDDVTQKGDRKKTTSKIVHTITTKTTESIFSTPSEDDIINQDLFKRIDCFDDDNHTRNADLYSDEEKEETNTSVLRQKNLDSDLFSRRSPKATPLDSVSTISSEDTFAVSSRKKKKKKRKHKKKNRDQIDYYVSELENHSERADKESIKLRMYHRENYNEDEKTKTPKKSKKSSKKRNKLQKLSRLLYISDDGEDDLVTNKNTNDTKLSENSNNSKRKQDVVQSDFSNESPIVILSDSNDEAVDQLSPIQQDKAEPPTEPVSQTAEKVLSPSNVESVVHTEPTESHAKDINNMGLDELNTIYADLCGKTGIQLEKLLMDLVGKSAEEIEQNSQIEVDETTRQLPQTDCGMMSPDENHTQGYSDNNLQTQHREQNLNTYVYQQNQIQYPPNQNQAYQVGVYSHPQKQSQCQPQINMQCQQPVQLPYQHTLRPGLNLNDPRIVQRLKQIKDSPIHNLSIRESANLLMTRHAASIPKKTLPVVPEVTSKTATTYGEHKRLRELEKKKELEKQNSRSSTSTKGHTAGDIISVQKCDKDKTEINETNSSAEDTLQKVTKSAEKTIMSFASNRSLSRSSSVSEDNLLSSERRTKSKESIASGRITPFEMEKVVDIVLSAIGPVNDDTSKRLRRLSRLHSRSSAFEDENVNENLVHELPNSPKKHPENENTTGTITEDVVKKRGRPASKVRKENPNVLKKSPPKIVGIRELNNLNCTCLDYKDIFENNRLVTNAGKRRSIASSNLIRDQSSSDEITQKSKEQNSQFSDKVTAAPIKRRRQTCSAIQDTSKPKKDTQPPIKFVFRRLSEGGTFGIENVNKSADGPTEADEKQQKPIQISKKVKVKLKKHNFNEIATKISQINPVNKISKRLELNEECPEQKSSTTPTVMKRISSSEEPILVPVSSEPVDCLTKSYPRPLRHLNINIDMTMNSTKVCAICNKRSLDLTSHYVIQHKTESYVSRLTSAEIKNLENEIKLATLNRKRYKITCVFCQDELEVHHFVQFYAHYSYHTGEYGFKCDVCEVVKPYREDIKSHQHRTARCRNGKIRTNYLYQPELKVIYLYICKLCNFVQLNEANVHKHQRDHHSFRFEEPQHVKKCIICALDDVEVINELLPSNDMEPLERDEEFHESSEGLVLHEQEFLHEYPLDIKDVLINIDNENNTENQESKGSSEKLIRTPTSVNEQQSSHVITASVEKQQEEAVPSLKSKANESTVAKPQKDLHATILLPIAETGTNLSPETLLGRLHGCDDHRNVMTIIHHKDQVPCVEHHEPYKETVDIKPNINELNMDSSENIAVSPVKEMSYRKISPETNFFGLYKCMVGECWFSTNEAEKYIRHADSHKVDGQKELLVCAYCPIKNVCSKQLVKHIRTRHSMSLYQCSICTYRSMVAGNVCLHLEMNHKDITSEKCIFKCVSRFRTLESRLAALNEKIKENVKKITCRDCPTQYYSLSSIKSHIDATQHNINPRALTKYACIFCELESNSLAEMQIHLVNYHPNDMCYVVERELNSVTDVDSIENLKRINISPPMAEFEIRVAEFKEEESEPVQTTGIKSQSGHANYKKELDLSERLRPLLELTTEKTGVCRAELYKCTICSGSFFTYELWLNHVQSRHDISDKVKCPYCPQEITLEEVVAHFESHLRHEYFCLHCLKTFGSKLELEDHFDTSHKDFEKYVEKLIVYSNLQKYCIMKGDDGSSVDWITTLGGFLEVLRNQCIEKLYENKCAAWNCDLVQPCFDDIDITHFVSSLESGFKCLVNSCAFESPDENTFDTHLNQHTVPRSYHCPICGTSVETTWECIKGHYMDHRKNAVHICCVCKFVNYNRTVVTDHIQKFHNSRDVPIITLSRSDAEFNLSLSIIMPVNKVGFVTTTTCFCCSRGMADGNEVRNHLINAHEISLCTKCELCGDILLNREEAGKHSEKHGSTSFIIRYDILAPSLYALCVNSISPFKIDMKRKTEKRILEVEAEASGKRIKMDESFCLKIKEEKKDDEAEFCVNNEKPSCSIKCVNIDQLVSSSLKPMLDQPAQSAITIKSIEALQVNHPPVYPSNNLNVHIQKSNSLPVDQNIPIPQYTPNTSNTSNTNMTPRLIAPTEHMAPKSIQFMPSQQYSSRLPPSTTINIQIAPPQQRLNVQKQTTPNTVPSYYCNNNIQMAIPSQTLQYDPTIRPPTLLPQQPKLPTQSQNNILNIVLPNNQGIATVSSGLPTQPPSISVQHRPPQVPSSGLQAQSVSVQHRPPQVQSSGLQARSVSVQHRPPQVQSSGLQAPSVSTQQRPPQMQSSGLLVQPPTVSAHRRPPQMQSSGLPPQLPSVSVQQKLPQVQFSGLQGQSSSVSKQQEPPQMPSSGLPLQLPSVSVQQKLPQIQFSGLQGQPSSVSKQQEPPLIPSSGLQVQHLPVLTQQKAPEKQHQLQLQNNVHFRLPNNQAMATVSRDLTPSYLHSSVSSYSNALHPSYQTIDVIRPTRNFQSNSVTIQHQNIQNSNQPMQTMEEIAKNIDTLCPEIMPICANCNLECTSFEMLLLHFQALHETNCRFLFRIDRRVECVYCPYRGKISSFTAHNNTFHPGNPFVCRNVVDQNRCGICDAVFNFNQPTNASNQPKCNCPAHKRVLADCINMDILKLLQKYGKKCSGFLCEICKKLFHNEIVCANHIKTAHNASDVLPKTWTIKCLLFSCFLCETTEMTIQNLITHIAIAHDINNTRCTLEYRLLHYKRIRLIYPRGLIVTLCDLSNTGYNEENLKKDIQTCDSLLRY